MYQGTRLAVKDTEVSVAVIAPSDESSGAIASKFDSINVQRTFINYDKGFGEQLDSLAPDVVVFYVDNDSAFLFKSVVTVKTEYTIPVLVISKDYDEFTAVLALELGADEYVSSHVGANELRLRLLKLCNKGDSRKAPHAKAPAPQETVEDIEMSNLSRSAFVRDRATYYSFFTPYEFEALLLLVSSPGKALARDTISLAVRGRRTNNADRSIDNIIARLRKKLLQLGFSKYLIRGFHSVGYVFVGDGEQFLDELEVAIKKEETAS